MMMNLVAQNDRYGFKGFEWSLLSVDWRAFRNTSFGRQKYNNDVGSHIAKRDFLIVSVRVSLTKILLGRLRTHTSL